MQHNFEQVPKILSTKDLDYLSDMFEWNYGALKKTNMFISNTNNNDVKMILEEGYNLFKNNLMSILEVLKENSNE